MRTINAQAAPAVSITPSSTVLDTGQSLTLTAVISGGASPYTFAWSGSVDGTLSSCPSSGSSPGSYQCTISAPSVASLTSDTFTIQVTDSNSMSNTSTTSISVNPPLVVGSITPSSPTTDPGQQITLTANPSGGTGAYTFSWSGDSTATACGNSQICTVSPSSSTTYIVAISDSSQGNQTNVHPFDTVKVDSKPDVTLTETNRSITTGQSTTLEATVNGGAGPFTVSFFNESSHNIINTSSGISAGTTTDYVIPGGATGTFLYNVTATDTGTHSAYTFNSSSVILTITSATASSTTTIISSTTTTAISSSSTIATINATTVTAASTMSATSTIAVKTAPSTVAPAAPAQPPASLPPYSGGIGFYEIVAIAAVIVILLAIVVALHLKIRAQRGRNTGGSFQG